MNAVKALARNASAAVAILLLSGCAYASPAYPGSAALYSSNLPGYGYYDGTYGPNVFVGVPLHHRFGRRFGAFHGGFHRFGHAPHGGGINGFAMAHGGFGGHGRG